MRSAAPWALVLLLSAVPLSAQQDDSPPIQLTVAPETGQLTVTLGDLLQDGSLRGALLSGLPLRVSVVTELWRDGFFDSERGRSEWRATVVHDPLAGSYQVESSVDPQEQVVSSLEEVGRLLSRSFRVPVLPSEPGRYYYLSRVEIETLSLSDLEELGRWLRGDLAPAVAGREEVEGAVAKGVRRLVVRVLGVPVRRFRVRTPSFDIGDREEEGKRSQPFAITALRMVKDSMRSRFGSTAIPAPEGRASVPLASSNSGLTRSFSQ